MSIEQPTYPCCEHCSGDIGGHEFECRFPECPGAQPIADEPPTA